MDFEPSSEETRTFHGVSVCHRRRPWTVAAIIIALLLALSALSLVLIPELAWIFVLFPAGVIPFALGVRGREYRIWKRDVSVRVGPAGLTVDGVLEVPRSSIREALAAATVPYGCAIRIVGGMRGPLELWMEDEGAAHSLVAALKLDPSRKTIHRFTQSALHESRGRSMLTALVAGASIALGVASTGAVAIAAFALAATLAAFSVLPSRVTVGSEGIVVRWLRRRFIPLDDIVAVGEWHGFVRLHLRSTPSPMDLPVAAWNEKSPMVAFEVAILADRIRTAIHARHAGEAGFERGLRVAAERSVVPQLRIGLEAAATDDVEAITSALE